MTGGVRLTTEKQGHPSVNNKRTHLLNILQLVINPPIGSSRLWNSHWDQHDQNHLHRHTSMGRNKRPLLELKKNKGDNKKDCFVKNHTFG